eukprot:381785_1
MRSSKSVPDLLQRKWKNRRKRSNHLNQPVDRDFTRLTSYSKKFNTYFKLIKYTHLYLKRKKAMNLDESEKPTFRRMSAEDEEMFAKPSSGISPVATSSPIEDASDISLKTKGKGPVLPELTDEKLKSIHMPKRIAL